VGFPIASRAGTASGPSGSDELRSAGDRIAFGVAVVGGAGLVPVAPGTVGSLFAVGLAVLGDVAVRSSAGAGQVRIAGYAIVIAAVFALGVWASDRAERISGRHDDGRIVIDEVVGQWIALLPIAPFVRVLDFSSLVFAVVTAFVAFRVLDIWKPGAVRWAERRFEGGLGVMADDVVAGVYGAVAVSFVVAALLAALPAALPGTLPAMGGPLP